MAQFNRNPKKDNVTPMSYVVESHLGKVPPQFKELEEAILACCLLDKKFFKEVYKILKSKECFYFNAHQIIYEACIELGKANKPIDLLTIISHLRTNKTIEDVGGMPYLVSLTNKVNSPENGLVYAYKLAEAYMKREIIANCNAFIHKAYDMQEDVFLQLQEMSKWHLQLLNANLTNDNSINTTDLSSSFLHVLENAKKGIYDLKKGIKAPYQTLEVYLPLGIEGGRLICIAGRPGMGKSALGVDLAIKVSQKHKVGFVSLEMTVGTKLNNNKQVRIGQLQGRLFSNISEVPFQDYMKSMLLASEENKPITEYYTSEQMGKIEGGAYFMQDANIEFDYQTNLNTQTLRNMILRFVLEKGCKMIIIDYLQLLQTDPKMTKNDGIGEMTRMLKNLTIELDIPIIVLAQLSRDVEKRGGDHKPNLSDLRDSGNIEQDMDIVIFPYRPEYYQIVQDAEGKNCENQTYLIVAKNRDGKLGEALVFHNLALSRYYNTYEQFIAGKNSFGSPLFVKKTETQNDPFYEAGRNDFF
jgi:replicative DNA helicase